MLARYKETKCRNCGFSVNMLCALILTYPNPHVYIYQQTQPRTFASESVT